ncbi:MAG: fibrobacter succinogenes major paralogous domain-containing protein [Bacteroidales bacterium]|nr:fibrobacter succinogenes major paralogous domain-containing protein [Bacteroidales bacterium]MDD4216794.1 fibrobacter succinogenes major paralogous domain-containing protein [Bacteroidales bacterium]MDY0142061.1 fibrobacter succinogenes major paralogous domain-containing protein [Bacteroidales bacterium]
MKKLFFLFILGASIASFAQTSELKSDVEIVVIGNQIWMQKNLDVTTFRNGDVIPEAKTNDEWVKAIQNREPAWCYYENDPKNGEKYGIIYNFYAVNDSRGLAPKDWHIPTTAEWNELSTFLGGNELAGAKLKSIGGWHYDGNGTNESKFDAKPAGYRNCYGMFGDLTARCSWWIIGVDKESVVRGRELNHDSDRLSEYGSYMKDDGLSVRCIKD